MVAMNGTVPNPATTGMLVWTLVMSDANALYDKSAAVLNAVTAITPS
jgi:hypothetical protein